MAAGTYLRVLDGVVFLPAIQACGIGVDRLDAKLRSLEEGVFLGEPIPGIGEIMGDDPGNRADAQSDGMDFGDWVLLEEFVEGVDDIGDDGELVHLSFGLLRFP